MEARDLDPDAMRTLVQHPAWKDFLQSYVIPNFERCEVQSRQISMEASYSRFCIGMAAAFMSIIEEPYRVAGYHSPLQRRYEFDEDLVSVEGKRKYIRKEKHAEPEIELPRRSSFAV